MVNVNNYVRMLNKICHLCFCYFYGCDNKPGWVKCACGVYKMEKEVVKLDQYLSSNNKYPERLQSVELTKEIKDNAVKLLNKINQLLTELKITSVVVSSGYRTSDANAKIPNAAKKSLHMSSLAIDISDPDGKLDELVSNNDVLLKKYGLWQESPGDTKGWLHLDCKDRGKRKKNQFKP